MPRKRAFVTCSLLIAMALCASPAAAGTPQEGGAHHTVVGGEYGYPPYSYSDAKGDPSGFNAELTRAIAGTMGLDVDIQVGPWAEIRKALENGEIDAIQGMFYSEERAQTFDFSPPFVTINHVVFGRRGSAPVRSTEELRGKELVVMRDDIMHDYAIQNGLSGRLLLASTPDDVLRLLASGKGDYALLAELPGLYWIKELNLSNITICGPPFEPSKYCYAVKKGDAILLSRITEGLNILQETGEYRRLYEKWLGVLEPSPISRKLVLKYVAAALVSMAILLAVTLLWSRMLRKEVDRKTSDLQESEARYRTLVENLPQKVFLKDRNSVYVSVNEAYARDLGVEPNAVAGKTDHDFFPEELAGKYRADDARIMEAGVTEDLEEEYVERGQRRLIHTVKTPVKDSQGTVTSILGILWDITEKKLAEVRLQKAMADLERSNRDLEKSEAALREAQRVAQVGHWEWSLATGAVTWSDETYRILGIPKGSVTPSFELFLSTVVPEDGRRVEDELARALKPGGESDIDIDVGITTPAGAVIAISGRILLDRDAGGNVVTLHGTLQDITQRVATQQALRESEAALAEAQQIAHIGSWVLDAESGEMQVSAEAFRIFAVEPRPVAPIQIFLDRIHEEDRAALEADIAAALQTGTLDVEVRIVTPDGTRVAHFVARKRGAGEGRPGLIGTTQDITEQKAAEEALRQRTESLELQIVETKKSDEAHRRLATVVEQAAETIVVTDLDGTIVYVNPAFESTTGYTRDEAIGQHSRMLNSGKQPAEFYQQLWSAIRAGCVWQGHFVNRRKDESLYEEEAVISPVRDASGTIINYVAIKRDVTAEIALAEQLRHAQKIEAIGTLAGGVAHDFNNLLQAMLSIVQLLTRKSAESPRNAEHLNQLEKTIRRGADLTRQLLLFARREVSKRETVDLNQILRDLMEFLHRVVRADIHLSVEPASVPLRISADRGQVDQVIMNLAVNAIDAMPEGGALSIVTGGDENAAWLEVSDTGTGIPEAIRARIFEPFFTTKEAGKGTGLGLSVVHGIIAVHGGRIDVQCPAEGGTTIRVELPLQGPAAVPEPVAPSEDDVPPGRGERVLLVEDDEAAREGLSGILETLGYSVVAVGAGEEALGIDEQVPCAVVLTDFMLPGMPGIELVRRLRKRRPAMKAILMSGYADPGVIEAAGAVSPLRFLQKPFEIADLARTLRDVLHTQPPEVRERP